MGDLCYYAPGHLNKLGKEGKTSWDSFSYFLMMAHNVYQHIESVQRANQCADIAFATHSVDLLDWRMPAKASSKALEIDPWVPRNLIYFNQLVDELFTTEHPMALIEANTALLRDSSKTGAHKSASTVFSDLFGVSASELTADHQFDEDEAFANMQKTNDV
jgi:hypothetical protein